LTAVAGKPQAPAGPETNRDGDGKSGWPAIFGYGFRPFFLLAGIYASAALPWWIAVLYLGAPSPAGPAPLAWHAHEMLYGFAAAAVAGFLLTAVPSWTGRRGYAGAPLAALVLLWLAGRLAMTFTGTAGGPLAAAIDLAFFPALALTLLPALLREGKRRNLVFIAVLALLFAANLQFHLDGAISTAPLRLGLNTMLLLLTLLGGRILPAFTSAGLKARGLEIRIGRHPLLDRATLAAVGAVLAVDLLSPGGPLAGGAAALGALLLALQLGRWQGYRCLGDPLLWVLHVAYAWLPVCLALKAAALFGLPLPANAWVHALTAGAMTTMIAGVTSRAGLGHTGRALIAPPPMPAAYLLLTAAALARVFGPLLYPAATPWWHGLSAALWSIAWLVFTLVYAPMLLRPRADGKPG
jgi:uncharacterized protein involved in response to NO